MTIRGDFHAGVTLSGEGVLPSKPVLGSLTVPGNILGSDIEVAGTSARCGPLRSAIDFFAGYSGPNDGSGIFDEVATVKSFAITGS